MHSVAVTRRILSLILACCFGLSPAVALADLSSPNPAWKVEPPPALSAGGAILMDWRTGQVLFSRDADRPRDPASTTKVLTAVIALERGKLTDRVKVSHRAAFTPGSSMYIREGQVYSLHDLLHGLLMRSGNDAAVAIAEHIAGSVEAFADLMNVKAKAIGAVHSHFANPHGLTAPHHVSTARDLALITRYALQNETFASIVSQRELPITYEYLNQDIVMHNTNRLLSMLEGADGVKTGTTAAAGRCLIASATREDQKLLAVVLNAGNRWNDAARLMEWGFRNFDLTFFGRRGEVLQEAPVRVGKLPTVPLTFSQDLFLLRTQREPMPEVEVMLSRTPVAPVKKGQTLGRVVVRADGQVKAESTLVAGTDVPRRTLVDWLQLGWRSLIRSESR